MRKLSHRAWYLAVGLAASHVACVQADDTSSSDHRADADPGTKSELAAGGTRTDTSSGSGGGGGAGGAAGVSGAGGRAVGGSEATGGGGSPGAGGNATGGASSIDGGSGGSATGSGGGTGGSSGTSGASGRGGSATAGGNGGSAGGALPPRRDPLPASYNAKSYTFPEPSDSTACSGVQGASGVIEHVAFAQTHVMEPGHPLFFLVAGRPALVEVTVTGAGAAPDIVLEASVNGQVVGHMCLKGPSSLDSSVSFAMHSKSDRYTATLPSAWVQPGLSVGVTAGRSTRSYTSSQLGVVEVPDVNLVMLPMDVLNYNEGKSDRLPASAWLGDFASAIPASRVRYGTLPGRVVLPKLATSHTTSDGSGVPPVVMDRRICDSGESPNATCMSTDVEPMDLLGSTLNIIAAIHRATGDFAYAFYFGNSENFFPGGWGGSKNFVGADFEGIFLHEQGHSFGLPHWGEGPYQATDPAAQDYRYPYGGLTDDGGGRGDSWNYYQNIGEYLSNLCMDKSNSIYGKERSDGMQRNHYCLEWRSTGAGPWDGFGDFSAFSILRNLRGAAEQSGTVPYRGNNAPYHLPEMSGYPSLLIDANGNRSLVRKSGTVIQEEQLDFLFPQAWDVPVATIYGSYHPSYDSANILYAPIVYQGTLPRVLNPTDASTFAALAKDSYQGYFYWPKDLTLKIYYADGSHLVALVTQQGPERNWSLGSGPWRGDMTYFALNVPADKKITKVELYKRPFCVRYANSTDEGNITNTRLGITAANFMDAAQLITTWNAGR